MTTATEAIERGWVCPDGGEHDWEIVAVGDRAVDATCTRCGRPQSDPERKRVPVRSPTMADTDPRTLPGCPRCQGEGHMHQNGNWCPTCNGTGVIQASRFYVAEDEPGGPACMVVDTHRKTSKGERPIVAYCDSLEDGHLVADALNKIIPDRSEQ